MKLSLVGTTGNYNRTALHWACANNREECVRLFLAHPQCNTDIVGTVNSGGKTAEMVATDNGYNGCARLIKDFANTSQVPSTCSTVNPTPSSSPTMLSHP